MTLVATHNLWESAEIFDGEREYYVIASGSLIEMMHEHEQVEVELARSGRGSGDRVQLHIRPVGISPLDVPKAYC